MSVSNDLGISYFPDTEVERKAREEREAENIEYNSLF